MQATVLSLNQTLEAWRQPTRGTTGGLHDELDTQAAHKAMPPHVFGAVTHVLWQVEGLGAFFPPNGEGLRGLMVEVQKKMWDMETG